jgi:hypothetical protein
MTQRPNPNVCSLGQFDVLVRRQRDQAVAAPGAGTGLKWGRNRPVAFRVIDVGQVFTERRISLLSPKR